MRDAPSSNFLAPDGLRGRPEEEGLRLSHSEDTMGRAGEGGSGTGTIGEEARRVAERVSIMLLVSPGEQCARGDRGIGRRGGERAVGYTGPALNGGVRGRRGEGVELVGNNMAGSAIPLGEIPPSITTTFSPPPPRQGVNAGSLPRPPCTSTKLDAVLPVGGLVLLVLVLELVVSLSGTRVRLPFRLGRRRRSREGWYFDDWGVAVVSGAEGEEDVPFSDLRKDSGTMTGGFLNHQTRTTIS